MVNNTLIVRELIPRKTCVLLSNHGRLLAVVLLKRNNHDGTHSRVNIKNRFATIAKNQATEQFTVVQSHLFLLNQTKLKYFYPNATPAVSQDTRVRNVHQSIPTIPNWWKRRRKSRNRKRERKKLSNKLISVPYNGSTNTIMLHFSASPYPFCWTHELSYQSFQRNWCLQQLGQEKW